MGVIGIIRVLLLNNFEHIFKLQNAVQQLLKCEPQSTNRKFTAS